MNIFVFWYEMQKIMMDPHIAADGFTYEAEALKGWLDSHDTSPTTNLKLSHHDLIPNRALRTTIQEWLDKQKWLDCPLFISFKIFLLFEDTFCIYWNLLAIFLHKWNPALCTHTSRKLHECVLTDLKTKKKSLYLNCMDIVFLASF